MYKAISYIGSKQTLLPFLSSIFLENHSKEDNINFYDCFSGTTTVLNYIAKETNWNLNGSDFSKYSDILSSLISFKPTKKHIEILYLLDTKEFEGEIFNELGMSGEPKSISDFTIFEGQEFISRMFFRRSVALKIDGIKKTLKELYENKKINREELHFFLVFLLHYVDNYANTTSIFGAYLKYDKHKNKNISFVSEKLLHAFNIGKEVNFLTGDIFDTLDLIEYSENNILYLDPPYNSRKYESNYHILNYIIDLDFDYRQIKENSKSALPKLKIDNLFGSKITFKQAFQDMIDKALSKSDNVYISLNSESLFSQDDMENYIIDKNIVLTTYLKDYKKYTSGESNGINNGLKNNVKEIVWYLKKT